MLRSKTLSNHDSRCMMRNVYTAVRIPSRRAERRTTAALAHPPPIPLPSPDLSVLNVHCSATGLRRTPSAPAPAGAKEFFQRRGAARKRALCAAAAAAAPRDAGWRAAAAGDGGGSVATTAAARRRVCAGLGAAHGTLNVRLGSWLAACR